MKNILSEDEKKYLRRTCRYLGSLGMTEGLVEFDLSDGSIDPEDVDWNYVTHFSNNYHAEIPIGLIPILKHVLSHVHSKDLIDYADIDGMNWERVEVLIDCDTSEISVSYDYGYYEPGETQANSWDLEEYENDEDFIAMFDELRGIASSNYLELDYNGSGDSGYIEGNFTNGDSVPTTFESWCYDILESEHGGWEINEGSQGKFEIDLDKGVIELYHQYNVDQTGHDTVFEEKF